MPRRATFSSFGASVSNALADRQMTQTDLAGSLGVSVAYANKTMTGRKPASPRWADLVADVLKMSHAQRVELHVAAAKDKGYKIDLTPSKKNRR